MKLERTRQTFEKKISNFVKTRPVGVDRQTNITKLIDAFRNFANVPKKLLKQLSDTKSKWQMWRKRPSGSVTSTRMSEWMHRWMDSQTLQTGSTRGQDQLKTTAYISSNPTTRTTDSLLKRIISTNCCIHMVVPHDDGHRYARNKHRLTKYTKNELCIKLVFIYTIISRRTVNKT